jgi:hypothetical protein
MFKKLEKRGLQTIEAGESLLNDYLKKASVLKKKAREHRPKKP